MNTMTAGQAAQIIDTFVSSNYENAGEKRKLLSILSLVNSYAWKKGVWPGMTAQFKVRVNSKTKEIITPHGYSNLLKVNTNNFPTTVRDQFFQFHQNGYGSIEECCSRNWSADVINLGSQPVIIQPSALSEDADGCDGRIKIAVSSDGDVSDTEETIVQGYHMTVLDEPEKRIYTRRVARDRVSVGNVCACEPITTQYVSSDERVDGVIYPINGCMVVMDDIYWGRVSSINKGVTKAAVDYFALNTVTDKFIRIARLEPNETNSEYRRYRVPDVCGESPCVYGLFKKNEPTKLSEYSEEMIIGDEEAIISLAMGMEALYFQKDPQTASFFLQRGIQSLSETVDQREGPEESPVEYGTDHIPDEIPGCVMDGY